MLPKINEVDFIAECAKARRKRAAVRLAPAHIIPGLKKRAKKRHKTGRRKAEIARAKTAEAKKKVAANDAARHSYAAQVKAYWSGAAEEHPPATAD